MSSNKDSDKLNHQLNNLEDKNLGLRNSISQNSNRELIETKNITLSQKSTKIKKKRSKILENSLKNQQKLKNENVINLENGQAISEKETNQIRREKK